MGHTSVLLVDDNPTMLRMVTRFLHRQAGIVVVGTASRGEEAVAQAQALQPQVVLLDLEMPGLNGLEMIPRLQSLLPDAAVIVLSLLDTQAHQKAALAAGADGFVSKAAVSTDLLPAIRRVVRAGRLQRGVDRAVESRHPEE